MKMKVTKTLEIETNKRYLIIEYTGDFEPKDYWNDGEMFMKIKFVCDGIDVNEETAKKLVVNRYDPGRNIEYYEGYTTVNDTEIMALTAFISAIETNEYFWGSNGFKKPIIDDFTYFFHQVNGAETINYDDYEMQLKAWEDVEKMTFHLERTKIFEIIQ